MSVFPSVPHTQDVTKTTERHDLRTRSRQVANTMSFKAVTQALALSLAVTSSATNDCDLMRALVYRGPTACEGCPESLRDLLKASYPNINVTFAGPHEAVQINAETLSHVDILAQPGGPGE
jgi:hypothetical protein